MSPSRILLVQDDDAAARRARTILQCAKYDVPTPVSSGEEITKIDENCRPDLVLIDIPLNGAKDALVMVRSIASRLDVPVLCLAEHEDSEVLDQSEPVGPVAYVVKPYEDRELLACVKAALRYHGAFRRRMNEFLFRSAQVQNITKRKSDEESLRVSEQRYRKLVEATTSYIYTVEVENGRPISTTHGQGCVFVTGYTSEEYDADPYLWYRMTYAEDQKEVVKHANEILSGKTAPPLEHRIIHKDGSVHWVRNTPVPHYDERGRLIAYDGLITCITEERKLKDQLHHAQKMEAIGQLAGGIAHDFNNILTAIISYASLIQANMVEHDPSRSNVDQILLSAERAASLTQRLLAFSRKQNINPSPVQINNAVQRVEKLLSRVLGEDIQLKNAYTASDATIMADSWQLEQVLINLATNARDAMPGGGLLMINTCTVELDAGFVKTHGYGEAGIYACIIVTDTGTGMDEATRKRIFEPFFTTKEVGKGTGLGLAIVYGIVKQLRGYIDVYSEPGFGTTFKVYLPLISSDVEVKKDTASVVPLSGKETVLLAEDDEHVRFSMRNLLEHYGYSVIEALEGEDAITKFQAHRDAVQLLIIDVIMPKKNGREVYEEIKKANPRIKALFTSGYPEEMVRQKGILEREVPFVTKPIPPAVFSRKIREVLDG